MDESQTSVDSVWIASRYISLPLTLLTSWCTWIRAKLV